MQITLAILSWISSAFASIGRSFSDHTGFWIVAAFFLGKHMPERIPITPQQFWTWSRDAIQSYIATKDPSDRPIKPVQTAPETNQ